MKYSALLVLLLMYSCQTIVLQDGSLEQNKVREIFEKRFEHSLISQGLNFPDFNYSKDSMDLYLVALHQNISIDAFRHQTGFTKSKIENIQNLLEVKGWLHYVNGRAKPSIFIATDQDGKALSEYATPIANELVSQIKGELPEINRRFNQTEISKTQKFMKWSFLILSDVLLDSWQIDNVETGFLKKETRPERHGKNYYYSIMENTENHREPFGIYGNQYEEENGKSMCIYGNNRDGVGAISTDNFISKSDNQILISIAEHFKPKLMATLSKHSKYITEVYNESAYATEITFEEFFIWWYHFIYTKATDLMKEENMLNIPNSGNFEYILEE